METLLEYAAIGSGAKVDRHAGIIRGCRIIGRESKNGRSYPADTLQKAVGLYEGASVNLNHPKGNPSGPRDYQDRLGRIRNVTADDGGLRGDFQFNPKHPVAEQLAWDAEHAPENVGFSHNVEARTSRRGGKVIVEEIVRVQSVDLVADPATTRGLFEQADPKRRLIEEIAAEIGMPKWCIPPLEGGLAYRESPAEIREYLSEIRGILVAGGTLESLGSDVSMDAKQFARAITTSRDVPLSRAEKRAAGIHDPENAKESAALLQGRQHTALQERKKFVRQLKQP